jgi:hypothetical protein
MERVRVERLSGETLDALSSAQPVGERTVLYEAAECKDCSNMEIESCPSNREDWHAQFSVTITGGEPLFVTRKNWRSS